MNQGLSLIVPDNVRKQPQEVLTHKAKTMRHYGDGGYLAEWHFGKNTQSNIHKLQLTLKIVGYVAPQRKPLTDEKRFDMLTKFDAIQEQMGSACNSD